MSVPLDPKFCDKTGDILLCAMGDSYVMAVESADDSGIKQNNSTVLALFRNSDFEQLNAGTGHIPALLGI